MRKNNNLIQKKELFVSPGRTGTLPLSSQREAFKKTAKKGKILLKQVFSAFAMQRGFW